MKALSILILLFLALPVNAASVQTSATIEEPVWTQMDRIAEAYEFDRDLMHSLVWCESRYNPLAVGYNKGSVDRGLWQINSYWHREVSDECAFDVFCSSVWAMTYIKAHGANEWACYK